MTQNIKRITEICAGESNNLEQNDIYVQILVAADYTRAQTHMYKRENKYYRYDGRMGKK